MPDFHKVASPTFSPTRCAACSTHACPDGFIDLVASTATAGFINGAPAPAKDGEPVYGRLYLCAWCVRHAARMVGCADPDSVAERAEQIRGLLEVNAQLGAELEVERRNKVVAIEDIPTILDAYKRSQQKTAPKPPKAAA